MAFVVDADGTPLARHGAVVDQRDERRRDEIAAATRVHGRTLRDQVGLETVTACLVEQHAAGALLDDDRHRTARCGTCLQLGDGLLGSAPCEFLDRAVIEQLEADGVAHRVVPGQQLALVVLGNDRDHRERTDLLVRCEHAIAVGNEDAARGVAVPARHLHDAAVGAACDLVRHHQQLDLLRLRHAGGHDHDVVHLLARCLAEVHHVLAAVTARCGGRCGLRGSQQTALRQVGGVRVPRGLPVDDADARAEVATAADGLDLAVIQARRHVAAVLDEDLAEAGAGGPALLQHPGQHALVEFRCEIADASHCAHWCEAYFRPASQGYGSTAALRVGSPEAHPAAP